LVPTKRRRHAITETPPVQAALDELRNALGEDKIELGELVVLGVDAKLAELRAERAGETALRRRLGDRIRSRELPVSLEAAVEVRAVRSGASVSFELLLDNSAWARLGSPSLSTGRTEEIATALEDGRVATCLPFLLETGYSARSAGDHSALTEELLALPTIRIGEEMEQRAIDAQAQLARAGHHRLPPVDLLIASIADRNGLGILHYDADFDVLSPRPTCATRASGSRRAAVSMRGGSDCPVLTCSSSLRALSTSSPLSCWRASSGSPEICGTGDSESPSKLASGLREVRLPGCRGNFPA
jgi:predicted nucleic acid-binding protein